MKPMYTLPGSYRSCAGQCFNDANCWGWAIAPDRTTCAFYSQSGREINEEYDAIYLDQRNYVPGLSFYDSSCWDVNGDACGQQR